MTKTRKAPCERPPSPTHLIKRDFPICAHTAGGRDKVRPQAGRACTDARRDKVRPQARRACTAARRGNVQPPAGRAHTAARRTAGGRDKVRPQAGRTCEQSMLSSYPASIVCLRAKHTCRPKYAFAERAFMQAGHASISARGASGVGWGWGVG